MSADRVSVSRRATLAGVAGGISTLSGCIGRPWSAWERDSPSQVELGILTPPEDDSIYALRIAQHLQTNLARAGIQADIIPTRMATFLRELLINHNYDLYVWHHPPQRDPDIIRPLLHSTFAEERGWQNPYGFTNSVVDELLDAQRRAGDASQRTQQLGELQEVLQNERPFIPLAFKEENRLLRRDRIAPPGDAPFHSAAWLAALDGANDEVETLQLGATDGRLTRNLNPVAVEYRGCDGVLDLVYDSLARFHDGMFRPWLARDWQWLSTEFTRRPRLEIELREASWHDGETLTAGDVAFTYAFLADTTITEDDPTIPSPRFRGPAGLVDSVEVVDERTLRLRFRDTTRPLALRALLVPILPEHVWSAWTEIIEVAGIPVDDSTTDALVEENLDPVGSGPYRVADVQADDLLVLERLDDHPFVDIDPADHPIPSIGPPTLRELVVDVRPSASNIAEAIRDGGLDGTISGVGPELAGDVRSESEVISVVQQTPLLFHVGFNHREYSPLSHSGFRTAVERLIDRRYLRDEIFGGSPRLTRTFVYDEEFVPTNLRWDETASTFSGDSGTGEIGEEAAREPFREAGFSYSEDGELLVN